MFGVARSAAIQLIDRPGLARRACECHDVVRREDARLLPALAAG